jgi:hypothetical protein
MPPAVAPEVLFARASTYARWLGGADTVARVREPVAPAWAGEFNERHLQCVWYDPKLRPEGLRTPEGELLEVLHPGRWNLEAGPDFLGAEFAVAGRRHRGDVEIHLSAQDWLNHGHARDPRYAQVALHVTYYPGALPASALPAACAQTHLATALAARPGFSFEAIDLTAYPYSIQGALTPVRQALRGLDAEGRRDLLESAGEERLLRKALALAAAIRQYGPAQALYREILAALGYKHNKTAFRRLADALPEAVLREKAGGDAQRAFALLWGASGLMPREMPVDGAREDRLLFRRAWDCWWKEGAAFPGLDRNAFGWRLDHLRPANHPVRRFMAAAWLFTRPTALAEDLETWSKATPRAWVAAAKRRLTVEAEDFWRGLDPDLDSRGAFALVGPPRAAAILINVLVPYAAAMGKTELFQQGLTSLLPAEPVNAIIKETAHALFGPDWPPSLITSALARQGLIQIFHDHLLDPREADEPSPP